MRLLRPALAAVVLLALVATPAAAKTIHFEGQTVNVPGGWPVYIGQRGFGKHLRETCKSLPDPDLAALFDHVYVDGSPELKEQKAQYVAYRESLEPEGSESSASASE